MQQYPGSYGYQPQPSAGGYQPPAPTSGYAGYQPPAAAYQSAPAVGGYQPQGTGYQPQQATGYQPPSSGYQPVNGGGGFQPVGGYNPQPAYGQPSYGAPAPQSGAYGAAPAAAAPYGGYNQAPSFGSYAAAPAPVSDHYTTRPFHQGGQHVLGRDRCPFYHKMGACRHFDSCTKVHEKPTSSRTVILPLLYPNPKITPFYIMKHGRETTGEYDKKWLKKQQEQFYEELFMMIMEYGRIIDMKIVDNLCEHLLGNVYVKFEDEVAAQNAVDGLKEKMYNGVLLLPELSPVHDFPEATCKEAEGGCKRAIQCNYWHPTTYPRPGSDLMKDLFAAQDAHWAKTKKRHEEKRAEERRYEEKPRESRDHRDRERGDRDRYERERSPRRGGSPPRTQHRREADDARLCHICGRTGHISKDCSLKD